MKVADLDGATFDLSVKNPNSPAADALRSYKELMDEAELRRELAADTTGGNRPSFTGAAPAAQGERLYDYLCRQARMAHPRVGTGRFGADMQVSLVNDGPVTIPMRIQ